MCGYGSVVSENVCRIDASPDAVFEVLTDGWSYAAWVVGAARVRAVDPVWPKPGGRIHHSFGLWPVMIHDTTTVEENRPGEYLRLKARAWPSGEGIIEFTLVPDGLGTEVRLHERPAGGPASLVPRPVLDPLVHWRNTETLTRLKYLAEQRSDAAE